MIELGTPHISADGQDEPPVVVFVEANRRCHVWLEEHKLLLYCKKSSDPQKAEEKAAPEESMYTRVERYNSACQCINWIPHTY